MTTSDYIAVYGAALSTFLAIPTVIDFIKKHFSSLRIICIDATRYDVEKGKEGMEMFHFFDITIINRANETKYFSHISIELKEGRKKGLVSLDTFFVNTIYNNKLESGQGFKEVVSYTDRHEFQGEQSEAYGHYRIKIEDSTGKIYKSKWYKSPIIYNPKTVKWKLETKPAANNT